MHSMSEIPARQEGLSFQAEIVMCVGEANGNAYMIGVWQSVWEWTPAKYYKIKHG